MVTLGHRELGLNLLRFERRWELPIVDRCVVGAEL
jgi:hypothetical protein